MAATEIETWIRSTDREFGITTEAVVYGARPFARAGLGPPPVPLHSKEFLITDDRLGPRAAAGVLPEENNGDAVSGTAGQAREVFHALAAVGVDLPNAFVKNEGDEKFEKSWAEPGAN